MQFTTNKAAPSDQKLRGGYYTPVALARCLCQWALRDGGKRVLEPSVGDGNFLAALSEANAGAAPLSVTAVELDGGELRKARSRASALPGIAVDWRHADFFATYASLPRDFDAVVGNPPFIRFQHFDPGSRDLAFRHLRQHGYSPTKLANTWAAFVQLAIELLRPGGRLAMVVPAELLQVGYAKALRQRITGIFEQVMVIAFKRLVFEGIQQEVVLLLAEGRRAAPSGQAAVRTLELCDADDLCNFNGLADAMAQAPARRAQQDVKWTALFLPKAGFDCLEEASQAEGVAPLGELADVDVGVVTGRNSFFVVDQEQAEAMQLGARSRPLVGRTSSLGSILFKRQDFAAHCKQHPSALIDLNGVDDSEIAEPLANYIRQGEAAGVNQGYKCRIRRRWYDVPSIYAPDAFLFRQIHDAPLLVANEVGAVSTDTIHRVRMKREMCVRKLAAAFCNSLTFAWAEVCGRSYGGGVLELEPREAEELPIPLAAASVMDERRLDGLLRQEGMEAALDYADPILLGDGLGLSAAEIATVRGSWVHLRNRRKNRRHAQKNRRCLNSAPHQPS